MIEQSFFVAALPNNWSLGSFRNAAGMSFPLMTISGENGERAPKIQGEDDGIVLPDLDIAKAGSRKWAEVKAKGRANFTYITNTYDHGIGHRNYCHYIRAQRETGCHVWLFIIEENTQILLAESLDVLGPGRRYEGDKMDHGGMVFWPRTAFRCRLTLNSIPGLLDRGGPLTFEQEK